MPLTTSGVAAQILACIDMYNSGQFDQQPGDCKVSLNNLIRAFSEAENALVHVPECEKIGSSLSTIDHVIPVAVLMPHLISKLKSMTEENASPEEKHSYIICFLRSKLILALLSKDDEKIIKGIKLGQKMPPEWCIHTGDLWARYHEAKIIDKYRSSKTKFYFNHRKNWKTKIFAATEIN